MIVDSNDSNEMIIPNFSSSTNSNSNQNNTSNGSPIQRKRVSSSLQGLNDIDRWLYMAKRSKQGDADDLSNNLHSASVQDLRKWETHIQKTAWMFSYSS